MGAINAYLTPEDLKKGELIDPGWYPAEITKYEESVVKGTPEKPTDNSMNAKFHFTITEGPYKGKVLNRLFNEKALGFGKDLWAALKFPFDAEKGYNLTSDLFQQTVGSKVMIYVIRVAGTKPNQFFSNIENFRSMPQ